MMYPFYPYFPYNYNSKKKENNNSATLSPPKKEEFKNNSKENIKPSKDDDVAFEIFGIKLFSDDVLLICLIFFLFQEGIEDRYLLFILILLLLS